MRGVVFLMCVYTEVGIYRVRVYVSTNDKLPQSHVWLWRVWLSSSPRWSRPFTRHRAKEALKLRSRQDHARICACPLVRQPTTTHLHSQSHLIASHARQPAVRILYPIPLAIPNNRVFPATQANRVPTQKCPQITLNSSNAPTVTATSL